jgi:hypothetical protein
MKTKYSQSGVISIYRHKVTGDYFIYFCAQYSREFTTVLITEEQAEKTSATLGIEIQVTMVPETAKRRLP